MSTGDNLMKCRNLFSGINKKKIIFVSSAKLAQRAGTGEGGTFKCIWWAGSLGSA